MVVDPSALIAVLQDESDRESIIECIETAESICMSVVSFVEASIVIHHRNRFDGLLDLDLLISKAGIELVTCDADQAYLARTAFRTYGKGQHPAKLNFGDCFSYALAKSRNEPLLFKGQDFSQTDIETISLKL